MKFLVDHMLGKLAKYLRFLGYDTVYPSGKMTDNEIITLAKEEGRVIITRDKELAKRSGGFLVTSDKYQEQLETVIKEFNLNTDNLLSRCSVCNEILIHIQKDKIKNKIPLYVYSHNDDFYICPKCGRIYWYGTHTQKIKDTIKNVMGENK